MKINKQQYVTDMNTKISDEQGYLNIQVVSISELLLQNLASLACMTGLIETMSHTTVTTHC